MLKEELEEDADDFFGEVIISGAQLTLKDGGRLTNAKRFLIKNGGTLFLDNSEAAHSNRLKSTAAVDLYAGTLAFDPGGSGSLTQELGHLTLLGGANQIDLHLGSASGSKFLAEAVSRAANAQTADPFLGRVWPTSTLNIRYIDPPNGSAPTNVDLEVPAGGASAGLIYAISGLSILPWATITHGSQVDWVQWEEGVSSVFKPLTTYYTGSPADWHGQHNVLIDASTAELIFDDPLSGFTQITSLKLANGGALVFGGTSDWNYLTLLSGGLLSTGSAGNQISGRGTISAGNDSPDTFYLHIHANLLVNGSIDLFSGSAPMIKTGEGTLRLTGDVWMQGGSLVINQGTVAFEQGYAMEFRTVSVGDGTGTDVLELPANHSNPITHLDAWWDPENKPTIFLHGTTHSMTPDSGEVDAAILRFGGGTIQHANLLHVEGRGTLDFAGDPDHAPNMFYLEEFTLADFDTTLLFIRHWEDGRDVLLVSHSQENIARINEEFLARIRFEGYTPDEGGATAQWVSWGDGTYWEIRPFPEPANYGALLGALGLGLFAWRRWKRGERAQHT
ncbi:hypothetical protein AXK12_02680 [Cephaloticoccus capnophilus]|uniref:PEP-CTERM protein-sorting domain-containing protein n=1 Tax=Cephaloticoccus capnophilus TaxID=1548208 RepID=A0A139SQQ2_9BACT|nr:hypothetical protein AXK12_02680 [Cephaloticoccus capnophilus]